MWLRQLWLKHALQFILIVLQIQLKLKVKLVAVRNASLHELELAYYAQYQGVPLQSD